MDETQSNDSQPDNPRTSKDVREKPKITFGMSTSIRRPIMKAGSGLGMPSPKSRSLEDFAPKGAPSSSPALLVIPLKRRPEEFVESEKSIIAPEKPSSPKAPPSFAKVVNKYDPSVMGLQVIVPTEASKAAESGNKQISSMSLLRRNIRQSPEPDEGFPDEIDPEMYKRMPIEEFGAAMLRGMGWDGNLESSQQDKVKSVTEGKKPKFLGLGANPELLEKAAETPIRIASKIGDDVFNNFVSERDAKKMIVPDGFANPKIGDTVTIIAGEHSGMKAIIMLISVKEIQLTLMSSGVVVSLKPMQVSPDPSIALPPSDDPMPIFEKSWIQLGMRVHCTGKRFKDGLYYWKIGTVIDINFDEDGVQRISMNLDHGQGIAEHFYPQILSPVRPRKGSLAIKTTSPNEVYRVLDYSKADLCHVQSLESLEVMTCNLGDLCEYFP